MRPGNRCTVSLTLGLHALLFFSTFRFFFSPLSMKNHQSACLCIWQVCPLIIIAFLRMFSRNQHGCIPKRNSQNRECERPNLGLVTTQGSECLSLGVVVRACLRAGCTPSHWLSHANSSLPLSLLNTSHEELTICPCDHGHLKAPFFSDSNPECRQRLFFPLPN